MKDPSNISITDIAKEAGVSATTVSRVLNKKTGKIRISQKTRELVLEVADRLGYQRNPFAAALRSNRTGIIGAINRAVSGTYMSRLAHHVLLAGQARNVELFIGASHESDDAIMGQLTVLQSQLFDGILFLGDLSDYNIFLDGDFKKPHVHIIPGNEQVSPIVTVDEAAGVQLALDHLINLGHTRIACIGSPTWPWDGRRMNSYRHYMEERGCSVPKHYVVDLDLIPYPKHSLLENNVCDIVVQQVQHLMAQDHPPTAFFATNDGVGANTIKGLARMGLRVPDDVSIVGYGNHHDSLISYPELTTVAIPSQELADQALDLLLKIIDNPYDAMQNRQRQLLSPKLIERESTLWLRA